MGSFIIWHLGTKRLARCAWRASARLHGRHQDKLGPGGIASTEPDGTQALVPWASIDRIRETKRDFHLIDYHGAVRVALPKRGLGNPDLLPALRELPRRGHVERGGRQNPSARAAWPRLDRRK